MLTTVVLAASVSLEYPVTDELPDIRHTRDRLLAKVFEFRQQFDKPVMPTDDDYEILYAYGKALSDSASSRCYAWSNTSLALVTRQIGKEIEISSKEIEKLFGTLNYDVVRLQ